MIFSSQVLHFIHVSCPLVLSVERNLPHLLRVCSGPGDCSEGLACGLPAVVAGSAQVGISLKFFVLAGQEGILLVEIRVDDLRLMPSKVGALKEHRKTVSLAVGPDLV